MFARYPTALGNGLCPVGATPVWAPWWVRGTNSYQLMMASITTTTLTTKLKNKEPDRNENATYYDRWFVIKAVDDDKPLSKNLTVRCRQGSKGRSRKCQINQMPSQWGSAGGGWHRFSKPNTFITFPHCFCSETHQNWLLAYPSGIVYSQLTALLQLTKIWARQKSCKGREICAKCGQAGHNGSPCSNDTKCPNCLGDHTAFSKECHGSLRKKCNE